MKNTFITIAGESTNDSGDNVDSDLNIIKDAAYLTINAKVNGKKTFQPNRLN
jgi:hypothetical protein